MTFVMFQKFKIMEFYTGEKEDLLVLSGTPNLIGRNGELVRKTLTGKLRLLTPTLTAGKYLTFISGGRQYYLHKVVWSLFRKGNLDDYGDKVYPIDGNHLNLKFDNLAKGVTVAGRKVKTDIWDIRKSYVMGHTIKMIAESFDVSESYCKTLCYGFDKLPEWLILEL